ncbi:hypothetical protein WJX81_000994 [Elliptochloris bilobata]|uniref:Uncharacterized protein n=1 Tax=Elliptochloris bilobata TaxID=381761 RepID=A0AAW1RJX5_9CHLO
MWQLLGAALRYRRVPAKGFKRLTSKQGNKNYYKGKGVQSTGHHTKLGHYQVTEAKRPKYMVPDLTGFTLKPYIAWEERPQTKP